MHPRLLAVLFIGLITGLGLPDAYAQIEAFPRPDTLQGASFGGAVAIEDSIAVVGASGASVCGDDSGAVFVYERQPGPLVTSWTLAARLVPNACQTEAFFGADVALSGSRLLVSASREDFVSDTENAAYVFERAADGTWTQTARLTGPPDRQDGLFGAGVALDGNRAAVSTSGNPDGAYSGSVYVYEYTPNTASWNRTARLRGQHSLQSGILGGDVTLDGRHLAVGASTYFKRKPGSVYIFRHDPAADRWHEDAHLKGINAFFIDLDLHDTTLLVGEDRDGDDGSGAATMYTRADSTWTATTTLHPSIPYESGSFGSAVSVHNGRALVTGYDEQLGKEVNIDRVVYVFRKRADDTWREQTILDLGTVDFGAALDLNGRTALIGSVPESETGTVHIARLP